MKPRFFPLALSLLFATLLTGTARGADTPPANPLRIGNARFTVVTPLCIRLEYSAGGKFVDLPSTFAANRSALYSGFKVSTHAAETTIDTGVIRLTYKPDGSPFSATNLSAEIKNGSIHAHWVPGAPNTGNLGGTLRTLDGADGAEDLGQGLISRDGWFLLDDSTTDLLTTDWVQARPTGSGADWYLFGYGDDYRAALKSLTAIGGAVPLPRKYALGAWYSRYWPYSTADYKQIVAEYAQHDFPLDNMVLDMDWHKDGWTGWSWNPQLLPDARSLLSFFHAQGLHDTLNMHPADGIGPQEDRYAPFMKDMGADPDSKKTIRFDAGDHKYMDAFFKDIITPLEDDGVDFWWLDWQQYPYTRSIPDLTNLFWLNTLFYQHTSVGGQRGMSFSRWAGWGDHRHPIHFSGDASTSFRMLAFEVPFTSTAGNVGCFFWSHDIGGHNRGRNEESYVRWVQFGATSPALRSHSTRDATMDRRPWLYPQWAEDSMRLSFHLRSQLFPYIYSSACQTARETVPLDRPLYIDYPREEKAYHNAQEYLFGDDILVAPVASAGVGPGRVARQTVWFPKDTRAWYNLLTGERYSGGGESLVAADIDEFPIFVRGGVPIPMQPYQARMASAPLTQLVVRCYPGEDGKTGTCNLYEDDGLTTAYQRGQSAATPLSYTAHRGGATITVGATSGVYAGQNAQRSLVIELAATQAATRATLDGIAIPVVYDPATQTNRITVPARPISEAAQIEIQAAPMDADSVHLQAAARRMAGVLGHPVTGKDMHALLVAALADPAVTEKERESLLGVAGVGVVHRNQSPILYHGAIVDTLYDPGHVLDSAPTTRPLAGDRLIATVTVGGQTIDLPADNGLREMLLGPDNIARTAKVTVSGTEGGYSAKGATDGILDGYPTDSGAEWSAGQNEGASIQLDWATPQTVDRVLLFDRPNLTDQITAGTVTFSDGTTLPVGPLPDDGKSPFTLKFPAKTLTWLKFTVTAVKPGTQNAGLSEIAVLQAKSK